MTLQGMQPEVPVIKLPKKPAPEPARNMTSIPITQKKAAPGLDLGRVPIKPEYQKLQNAQAWFQVLTTLYVLTPMYIVCTCTTWVEDLLRSIW